jgi:hypothetical protein
MDSLKKLEKDYPKSYRLLQNYLNLDFGNTKIKCPYWINKLDKKIRGPFGGKGLPGQLVGAVKRRALVQKIKIAQLGEQELNQFLQKNRIGVDCSGFAYNLTNSIDRERGGNGIAEHLFGIKKFLNWNPAWRAGSKVLTDESVTKKVKTKNVQIGDIIRIDAGNHVMVVVSVKKKEITYAHSSKLLTRITGVHLGKIRIKDANKDLSYQEWEELTPAGDSLGRKYLFSEKGDGLRRFNWW